MGGQTRGAGWRTVATITAGLLALSACTSTDTPEPASSAPAPVVRPVTWTPCGSGAECGSVEVPLDHGQPHGGKARVALARRRAADPGQRRGVLLVAPGGPGESGAQMVAMEPDRFTPALRQHFDLVGIDPRGVAASTAVRCPRAEPTDVAPEDAEEFERIRSAGERFAKGCAERTGELVRHLDSRTSARDVELVRRALGEEQVSLYGSSYGTLLAASYAELEPRRVRAMVLDGVVDRATPLDTAVAREAAVLDEVFRDFTVWCGRTAECALHGRDVGALWDDLVARAKRAPIPTSTGQGADDEALLTAAYRLLYSSRNWPALAESVKLAVEGDAGAFVDPAESPSATASAAPTSVVHPAPDPEYDQDGLHAAVVCADRPPPFRERDRIDELARRVAGEAPRFGAHVVWSQFRTCLGWPDPGDRASGPLRAPGLPPALVLGSNGDVATPLLGAKAVAEQLPGSAVLVLDADEHGTYGGLSTCVDTAVERYLVDGALPPSGTTCAVS
ncbi:alpha/beta hydrolase [Streptoalloteichus hindustanus]|uniref:Alpha/beta hydrolase fold n=1 Tax=Streptoalloteichus hindustanus TaxID=2017 RepID=A0A1M4U5C4_STRHI|nr:alpha/beta hydrolase [Streptoalloteichus hindustanus]SHE51737.1 alpha/beta hydrolase fold [Streptoalloteichus hindustanus]